MFQLFTDGRDFVDLMFSGFTLEFETCVLLDCSISLTDSSRRLRVACEARMAPKTRLELARFRGLGRVASASFPKVVSWVCEAKMLPRRSGFPGWLLGFGTDGLARLTGTLAVATGPKA